jgi:secondary thiamine-phosphate synthase enzyme
MVIKEELVYDSRGNACIIDVTSDVQDLVSKNELENGQVLVFVPGATASVTTIETENGLLEDFKEMFERMIPGKGDYYHHDDNGHSHLRASLLGPSVAVPVAGKKLLLGTWQSIVLVDFDTRPRKRKIIVQLTGEK